MPAPLGELSVERFLADHWQKRPCVIRRAFPDFSPDFDGDDLAGLACEPLAEARLVSGSIRDNDWALRHGPFEARDFASLPEANWTLLVQDVEKHYPPLCELLEAFDFLPTWRIDDLMMSWAAPGGSVGPHVDHYDVFLLQAVGRRRWQIARQFDPELLDECPLPVLRRFHPEDEYELDAGDMLYLPPGVAHHGVALEAGMTWSIGLRAPDVADLMMAFGETLAAGDAVARYADPGIAPARRAGEVDGAALAALRNLMRASLDDAERFADFAAGFLSRFRLAQQPAAPEKPLSHDDLRAALASGAQWLRNPWTRLAWVARGEGALLFAAGDAFTCTARLAQALCARYSPDLDIESLSAAESETLLAVVNAGHLVLWNPE